MSPKYNVAFVKKSSLYITTHTAVKIIMTMNAKVSIPNTIPAFLAAKLVPETAARAFNSGLFQIISVEPRVLIRRHSITYGKNVKK